MRFFITRATFCWPLVVLAAGACVAGCADKSVRPAPHSAVALTIPVGRWLSSSFPFLITEPSFNPNPGDSICVRALLLHNAPGPSPGLYAFLHVWDGTTRYDTFLEGNPDNCPAAVTDSQGTVFLGKTRVITLGEGLVGHKLSVVFSRSVAGANLDSTCIGNQADPNDSVFVIECYVQIGKYVPGELFPREYDDCFNWSPAVATSDGRPRPVTVPNPQ